MCALIGYERLSKSALESVKIQKKKFCSELFQLRKLVVKNESVNFNKQKCNAFENNFANCSLFSIFAFLFSIFLNKKVICANFESINRASFTNPFI